MQKSFSFVKIVVFLLLSSRAYARRPVVTTICSKVDGRISISCLTPSSALLKSEQIFARTQFTNPNFDTPIWHIWINNNQEIYRKKIHSQSGGFRAVTSVHLKNRDGQWRFQIIDEKKQVLEEINFITADGPNGFRGRLLTEKEAAVVGDSLEKNTLQASPVNETQEPQKATVLSSEQAKGRWLFNVGPRLNFTKLNSTQKANSSTATFLSEMNPGLHLAVDYQSADLLQITSLAFNLDSNKYKSVAGKSLNSIMSNSKEFSISHQVKNIFSSLHADASLGVKDDFFDRASSTVDLNFRSVQLPFIGLGLQYDLYRSNVNAVEAGVHTAHFFKVSNSDYSVDESNLWQVQILDRYSLSDANDRYLIARAFFDKHDQSTSLISRTKENLGFELLYSWEIGK